jgi:hypothetical protein
MKEYLKSRKIFHVALLILTLLIAVPTSFAQGRGHGRWNNTWLHNRKCAKFVNCHDARNGRWDGRGPRSDRVSNIILRNRLRTRRQRDFDNDRFNRSQVFRNDDFGRSHMNMGHGRGRH